MTGRLGFVLALAMKMGRYLDPHWGLQMVEMMGCQREILLCLLGSCSVRQWVLVRAQYN